MYSRKFWNCSLDISYCETDIQVKTKIKEANPACQTQDLYTDTVPPGWEWKSLKKKNWRDDMMVVIELTPPGWAYVIAL